MERAKESGACDDGGAGAGAGANDQDACPDQLGYIATFPSANRPSYKASKKTSIACVLRPKVHLVLFPAFDIFQPLDRPRLPANR